jgi:hypothetical protein
MLFMGVDTWTSENRNEVVKRMQEKGLMVPEGCKIINIWTDVTGGRNFVLFEADSPDKILAWIYAWSDIIKFEITPVMEMEKVMQAIQGS